MSHVLPTPVDFILMVLLIDRFSRFCHYQRHYQRHYYHLLIATIQSKRVRLFLGAFLIPYLILLLLVGKPMYYMEVAIGQFSQQGPLGIWKLAPLFTGNLREFSAQSGFD